MPIIYTTEDNRTEEQKQADDRIREEFERTGGAWAQMTPEQREEIRARLREKKLRAMEARAREQESLEERVARLEERVTRLGG